MPIRLCSVCRENQATARGKCDDCRHDYERDRSRDRRAESHKAFYDTRRWRLAARHKKNLNPICEHCDHALSQEVHHDPPLRVLLAAKRNPYDPAVLVAPCKPCHSVETMREQHTG
jgi:hypothetical protein